MMANAVLQGGRLIFVGAGTSGRLGVLEAADGASYVRRCRPKPQWRSWPAVRVQCTKRKEGVEDDHDEGARALRRLHPVSRTSSLAFPQAASPQSCAAEGHAGACRLRAGIIGITCDARCRCLKDPLGYCDRVERWTGSDCRFDEAQGRYGDQGSPEHAYDNRDGTRGEDVREPDG